MTRNHLICNLDKCHKAQNEDRYTNGLVATIQGLWRYPVFSKGYNILTLTTQKERMGYQPLGENLLYHWH
jgi:hypothetical protein